MPGAVGTNLVFAHAGQSGPARRSAACGGPSAGKGLVMEVLVPELKDSCVKPVRGPILPAPQAALPAAGAAPTQEARKMLARVGQEAIDFEASAFVEGVGFQPVKLSDHKGQWIVLCFYPGDFTFV